MAQKLLFKRLDLACNLFVKSICFIKSHSVSMHLVLIRGRYIVCISISPCMLNQFWLIFNSIHLNILYKSILQYGKQIKSNSTTDMTITNVVNNPVFYWTYLMVSYFRFFFKTIRLLYLWWEAHDDMRIKIVSMWRRQKHVDVTETEARWCDDESQTKRERIHKIEKGR